MSTSGRYQGALGLKFYSSARAWIGSNWNQAVENKP